VPSSVASPTDWCGRQHCRPLQKNGYQIRPLKPGYNQLLEAGFEKAKD